MFRNKRNFSLQKLDRNNEILFKHFRKLNKYNNNEKNTTQEIIEFIFKCYGINIEE